MLSVEDNEDELLEKSKSSSSNQLEEENIADEDELLLLSSPSSSPKTAGTKKANLATRGIKEQKGVSLGEQDVVDLLDEDLEIVEEVSTIPDASISDADVEEESLDLEESEEDEDESLFVDGKINIFHDNGAFFLWNAEDVQMLREECRIIGKLIGCLPRAPRQNLHLGLPLQLMPEEAKLLVDIDAAAVIVEKPVADTTLQIRKAAFENVRQQNFQIQQRLYKKQRKEDVSQRMDTIIAGKKAKKRKLKEASNRLEKTSEEDAASTTKQKVSEQTKEDKTAVKAEDAGCAYKSDRQEDFEEHDSKDVEDEKLDNLTVDDIVTTETSEAHALVQVFTENPWKQNIKSFDWNFPNTERDLLRYYVFKDLWGKGFYLTSGSKFGGDFLVYPGDPARYHSHYIAVCRSQYDEMPCLDLVSLGRLASNVRKTALLCSLDRNRKVIYTSLTWTGLT